MEQSFNKVVDLLYLAKLDGVDVLLNDGRLQLKVQKQNEIDENLLREIRNNKQLIIDYLVADIGKTKYNNKDYKKIYSFNRDSKQNIPLSFGQERLWFIDQLDGSIQYHFPAVFRLRGKVNIAALGQAIKEIINRHNVLRTVFYEKEGNVYQTIKKADDWQLKIVEDPVLNDKKQLGEYINGLIKAPFNLSLDYPIRGSLICLSKDEFVLVVTMHHIASDAWSLSIIVSEVVELYNNFSSGKEMHLAPLPLQYADYAVWQRNYLKDDILNKGVDYWKQKLGDVSLLQLPSDFMRPLVKTNKGASHFFYIKNDLSLQVQELGRQHGCSLFMVFLSAFKVLLYRYSGQNDICVGTSIAIRHQKELEGLIGFFVNTLALRDELNPEDTFLNLLYQVRGTALEAYENQEIPFEKVVETVVSGRDTMRTPLFQVMLVLTNTPEASSLKLGEIQLIPEPINTNISKFDFTFFINRTASGCNCTVEYSTDLYIAESIKRMCAHFVTLLGEAVKNPQQQIGKLEILDEAEQEKIFHFNHSSVVYPLKTSVTALFEQQAGKKPGSIALLFEGEELSYRKLNERSNQLANYLKNQGITPGALVPLFIERSSAMMIGILGIMKAGGAYVPIDTDFPVQRINYMIEDTGAEVIVCSSKSARDLHLEKQITVIEIDDTTDASKENLPETPAGTDAAYVIYTSGSTGKPKGVIIQHKSLIDYYYGLNKQIQIDQCLSFALVSTIATDLGNTVIYGSLLSGGVLHIMSKDSVSNIEYLHNYFSEHNVDCLKIVPSHWQALKMNDKFLMPKKLLVFGGEALPNKLIETILSLQSTCRLVNHYGPTETTIGKLLHEINQAYTYDKTVPIGKPFSNTHVYVLSKEMKLCPIGVPGELYVGGDGVALGYLNNAALSKQKFLDDAITRFPSSKMYKTGDVVKWLSDGNIQFIGRADDQVKIRGYRIELGEVESVLLQSDLIHQAVILAINDKHENARLVAYIVPKYNFDKENILTYLKEKLPDYMIPSVLVELDAMPLTANGKLDKKMLPDPDTLDLNKAEYIAPGNEVEVKLANIWEEILEVDKISVHDDFFELGGHSLLAVRLISAIRKAFIIEMPISDIFDYPTISLLAKQFTSRKDVSVSPVIPKINDRPQHIPLSFSQERLWFIHQLQGSAQYHIPTVIRLRGKLNKAFLSAAFKQIIHRHEVLRTIIKENDEGPFQVIMDVGNWKMQLIDGSAFPSKNERLSSLIKQLIGQPFNLAVDYMIRVSLVSFDDEDHLLVVTLHHISSDGWSNSIIVKELAELYNSAMQNRQASLQLPSIQYADYSIWQRNYLSGSLLDQKLDYWKTALSGLQPLQLHTDYVRPPVQSTKGAIASFVINEKVSGKLDLLCKQNGATLFMGLLTVIKILLYRYTRQYDICVGTPVAGRSHQEVEGLIGFFINTLPLRTQSNKNMTGLELMQQVRSATLDAYAHQDVPFEKVVDAVTKERDMSRTPLFQVMLVLQNTPEIKEFNLTGLSLEAGDLQINTTSKFDLTFNLRQTAFGLNGVLEYCPDLFSSATIERMLAHFKNVLQSLVESPSQKIGLLKMLDGGEQKGLIDYGLGNKVQHPALDTVISLFEQQVSATPLNVAVVFAERKLNYNELNERANQLAHYLTARGIKRETLVPIFLERCEEMLISILGILKAGGAYIPIDTEYPKERVQYLLEDSNATIIISNQKNAHNLSGIGNVEVVSIDGSPLISEEKSVNPCIEIQPQQLAYVLYTSGTTGRPKGVMIQHDNLLNYLINNKTNYLGGPAGTSGSFIHLSYTFDASITALFMPLLCGKSIVISSKETVEVFEDTNLAKYAPYDFIKLTPSHLPLLETKISGIGGQQLANKLVIGGEALFLSQIQPLISAEVNMDIINEYGPTEGTVGCSVYTINTLNIAEDLSNNLLIGKPIDNVEIYLVSEDNQLVPVGVTGELCIAGAGVARGYLNKPELTAEKFVENPFNEQAGARMYKTGDLARWLPDGSLQFEGRIDDQVKVKGYRIELTEIEGILQQSELVKQAVVLAKKDSEGVNRLVAYVLTAGTFNRDFLIAYLKEKIPGYMVPDIWVPVESFALTTNGKIDKAALPDPELTQLVTNVYTLPRNVLEEKIADIWKKLLKVERVGIFDNFFELGGHSLIAMRLVAALRNELNVELPIKTLFLNPTIAWLSIHLSRSEDFILLPAIEVYPKPAFIPLSFSQERLWFIDQFSGSTQYHMPFVLRLNGLVDTFALDHALNNLVNRHEVLRTVIGDNGIGGPYQKIMPVNGIALSVIDGAKETHSPQALQTRIQQIVGQPFDLSADYMIRATLISLHQKEHILVVTTHHIASDGWSVSIIINELVEFYNAHTQNRLTALDSLAVQYSDYAIWQRNYLQEDVLENKIAYWKEKLEGISPIEIPLDFNRPTLESIKGDNRHFNLGNDLLQRLKIFGQQHGATLFMTLLGAFKVLLHRYSGQEDICVGTPIAGRQHKETEGLVGFFVNTLALRTGLKSTDTFVEVLNNIRNTTLEAYGHQDVPFEKVVEAVVKKRELSRSPVFQVMFILQNAPAADDFKIDGIELTGMGVKNETSKFELIFSIAELPAGLSGTVEFCSDLFKAETIERMIAHFKNLLNAIVKAPHEKIGLLSMLSKVEEQQVLNDFNQTSAPYPVETSIVKLFEKQVESNSNLIAVVFESRQITYQQLNDKSNQLAHYLIGKGVAVNDMIPICIERSIDMLIGVMAILKAGAAYVPLDPDYPPERISYMVSDISAKLIITSAASRKCLQPAAGVEVIEVNSGWSQFDDQSKLDPDVAYRPDNLAYVIYTSGSTGRPKGVKMQSGALVNLLTWQESQFVNKKRRVMQFASLNFDVSFQEIFSTLCSGCTLYLINADRRKDVIELVKDITTYGLTHLFVPYIVLKNIAENILAVKNQSFWLEEVIVAGEQLIITDDIKSLLKKNIGAIINQYGPTEAHVVSSYRIDGTTPIPLLPPIGKPIANTQLFVLGRTQELVPVGVAGELYIGGVQVAAGYINQPVQTSEKFIADFFSKDEAPARLYKTGDLARWLPDGNMEYLGRIDNQVKIRGFRIELGEIESVLLQSGLVTKAVVVAKDDKSGNKVLVGYVVPAGGFDKEAIQLYLQSKLPGYMVPALWVALENIALTNNGKVDKRALPEPDAMELLSNPYLAPGNELEEKLAVIWQDVLHVERVGITDNFFELGGHSLIAMRLVAVIRQQLDLKLAVNDIFIYPTIKAFTKNLIEKFKNPSLPLLNNKYLVPLKTTGNKIPLYIIAGGGGTSLRFKKFAEMMDKDQPVYGLQSPIDLPDIKEFPDTIEKIAAKFIEEILTINPNGPYALSGHCLGGIIAFEMAQQLQQKGKQLHQLLMFDTIIRKNENVQPANFKNLYHFKYRVQHAITKVLIKFDFETFLLRKHTRQAIRYKVTAMHRMYDKLKKKDQGNEDLRFGGLEIFDESSNVYIAAARKYKMQPYNGEIILFYAKEHYYFMDISKNVTYRKLSLNEKTKNLWKEFSSGVKIHDVAGEHSTIFDPAHGNDFAQLLQMYLDDKASEEGKPS